MNVKKLLAKGYFPKELPPPFNSDQFADKSQYIRTSWETLLRKEKTPKPTETNSDAKKRFQENYVIKFGSSKCCTFSLAKGIYSRRVLSIPNPKQYYDLASFLVNSWSTLRKTHYLAKFSASTPIEANSLKRSVRTKSESLNNFKFLLIEKSFNKLYELRLDISQFYPTIYTHSLAWGILGKSQAKHYFNLKNNPRTNWTAITSIDPTAKTYAMCEMLDTLARNCQERQSIGLPIGPDTSFILAEVIGNRIDKEIELKLSNVKYSAARYYDDYYFYVDTYNDAELILKNAQQVFNTFQLETNESKVSIKKLPFSFESAWVSALVAFRFSKIDKFEIRNFYSLLFRLLEENRKESYWIIQYALGRFEFGNTQIPHGSWDIFLNLLIKTQLIDSSNLDQFLKIILSYQIRLNSKTKLKIKEFLEKVIGEHLALNHSYEVAWSLWIMKSLKIRLNTVIADSVFKSQDNISKLICLDIVNSKLYSGRKPSVTHLVNDLSESDLSNEKWLFAYEAIKQKWLKDPRNIIKKNQYFSLLEKYDISFYETANQVSPEFYDVY